MRSSISQLSASYSQRSVRRRREHTYNTEDSIPGDEMLEILRRSQLERRTSASQPLSRFAVLEPSEDAAAHIAPNPPMYSSLNKKNVSSEATVLSSAKENTSEKRPQKLNASTLVMGNHLRSNPLSPNLPTPNLESTASNTPHVISNYASTTSTAAPTPMHPYREGNRENLFSRALLQNSVRVVGEAKGSQTMKPIVYNAGVQVDLIVEAPQPPPVQPPHHQLQHYPALEQHIRSQLQNALRAAQVEENRERALISDVFNSQWKKLTAACVVEARHRQEMEREMASLLQPRRSAFNTSQSANNSANGGGPSSALYPHSVNTSYNNKCSDSAPQQKSAAASKLDSSFKKSLNWIREHKQQQLQHTSGHHHIQSASANTTAQMGGSQQTRWGAHSTPPSFLKSGALV